MATLASDVRQRYLAVSGGWLGSFVIGVSKALGIWDPLIFSIVVVFSYVMVRTCAPAISLVLGLYFDAAIPFQYWQIDGSYELHQDHLDDYWPVFGICTLVEIGALVVLDPEIFTLVACLKTIGLTGIWIGRKANGVFLSSALRRGKRARPSPIPVGGVDWVGAGGSAVPLPPPLNPAAATTSRGVAIVAPGSDQTPRPGGPSGPSAPVVNRAFTAYRADEPPPRFPVDPRFPDAEKQLRANYPDPWTRWGMLNELARRESADHATKGLKEWLNTPATSARANKYAERAHQAALMFQYARATAGGSPATLSLAAFPSDSRHPKAEQQLRGMYPDPWARWGMLYSLRSEYSVKKAKQMLAKWLERASPSQTKRFAADAKRIIWAGQPAADGQQPQPPGTGGGKGNDAASLPPPPEPNLPAKDLAQLRKIYPDKTTQWGMLNHLATHPDTAKSSLAQWLQQPPSRTRAKKYADEARQAIERRGPARADRKKETQKIVPPGSNSARGGAKLIGLNLGIADKMLSRLYSDPLVRQGMIETYRGIDNDDEAESMLQRLATENAPDTVAARVKRYRPRGEMAEAWAKELTGAAYARAEVPKFVEPQEVEWNRQLKKLYPDAAIRYNMLLMLRETKPERREARFQEYLKEADKVKVRNDIHGERATALFDLWDDEGYDMVTEKYEKPKGEKGAWQSYHPTRPGTIGGHAVKQEKLDALSAYLETTPMTRSDRLKILEVFSRPRCSSQETAAFSRITDHKGKLELSKDEKASAIERYKPKLHVELCHLLMKMLAIDEGNREFPKSAHIKSKLVALKTSAAQSREELVDTGAILGAFRLEPSTEPERHVAANGAYKFNSREMLDLRLQLLKRYQDRTVVDLLFTDILHCPTQEDAVKQEHTFIYPSSKSELLAIYKKYTELARRPKEMEADLKRRFPANIAHVMMRDILAHKDPKERESLYRDIINKSQKSNSATKDEWYKKFEARAARPEYFEKWDTDDNEYKRLGWFEKMLNRVG